MLPGKAFCGANPVRPALVPTGRCDGSKRGKGPGWRRQVWGTAVRGQAAVPRSQRRPASVVVRGTYSALTQPR